MPSSGLREVCEKGIEHTSCTEGKTNPVVCQERFFRTKQPEESGIALNSFENKRYMHKRGMKFLKYRVADRLNLFS